MIHKTKLIRREIKKYYHKRRKEKHFFFCLFVYVLVLAIFFCVSIPLTDAIEPANILGNIYDGATGYNKSLFDELFQNATLVVPTNGSNISSSNTIWQDGSVYGTDATNRSDQINRTNSNNENTKTNDNTVNPSNDKGYTSKNKTFLITDRKFWFYVVKNPTKVTEYNAYFDFLKLYNTNLRAKDMMHVIPELTKISYYDEVSGKYVGYVSLFGGLGTNFVIKPDVEYSLAFNNSIDATIDLLG